MNAAKIFSQALKIELILFCLGAVVLFVYMLFTVPFSLIQSIIVAISSVWILILSVGVFRSQLTPSLSTSLIVIGVLLILGLALAVPQYLTMRHEGRLDISNLIFLWLGVGLSLLNLILLGGWFVLTFFRRSPSK